jgi:CBS-domain-containing membrane protein
MTSDVSCCFEDESLDEAAARMAELQVRRLPVLDRSERLVGILALGDVAGQVQDTTAGQTLEEISQPTRSS